ncbi:unnamed protein product [Haemonchus placei]|uniref:Peroxisome assembly protein 12 n=1 Tax=Haemonchus placei TaxID=6290 RepID=A0A0N4WPA7_HAEPC|nr:unnamed protein product [Haemonchus placei]
MLPCRHVKRRQASIFELELKLVKMSSTLRASHMASFKQAIGDQPSIFDIISQESLMTSLKPAMGHLVKFLAMVYSQRFQTAHRYYDELYLLFDLILQNQYLKKYGASFSENFYGMKRICFKTGTSPSEFSSRVRNLMLLVLWPYVRDKFDKLYILNRTTVHSPFLLLAGVRLEKLTQQDIEAFDKVPLHLQSAGLALFFLFDYNYLQLYLYIYNSISFEESHPVLNRLWRYFLALPGVFSRLFGYGLFFIQFIDFIYNSDLGSQLTKKPAFGRIPPAPHRLLTESSVQMLDTNKCPLCLQQRTNDTALSVSGYVFCFKCIERHVKDFKTSVLIT